MGWAMGVIWWGIGEFNGGYVMGYWWVQWGLCDGVLEWDRGYVMGYWWVQWGLCDGVLEWDGGYVMGYWWVQWGLCDGVLASVMGVMWWGIGEWDGGYVKWYWWVQWGLRYIVVNLRMQAKVFIEVLLEEKYWEINNLEYIEKEIELGYKRFRLENLNGANVKRWWRDGDTPRGVKPNARGMRN